VKPLSAIKVDCEFGWDKENFTKPLAKYYYCELKSLDVLLALEKGEEIPEDPTEHEVDLLSKVQMLRIRYPLKLDHIPASIFQVFENLEYLNIYHTGSFDIEQSNFQNATKLRYLRIHSNVIRELNDGIFELAPNLEYINLSYNKISLIHKDTFSGLSKLIELHLNDNKLLKIHSKAFAQLPKISLINLRNNECIKEPYLRSKNLDSLETALVKRNCHRKYLDEIVQRNRGANLLGFSGILAPFFVGVVLLF
jgi:Leucine-rich repeat (LRR) protein